jgi:hypothetical protein
MAGQSGELITDKHPVVSKLANSCAGFRVGMHFIDVQHFLPILFKIWERLQFDWLWLWLSF